MINEKLFECEDYILTAIDFEKDPEIDSGYSLDLRYARYWCDSFTMPLSRNEFKKKYEKIEKKVDDTRSVIHFAIRTKVDHHLIGFVRIHIMWNHAVGWLVVAIGNPEQYKRAEQQIFPLILKYAFHELNLFRLEVDVPAFESDLGPILEKNGFRLDAVNRGVIYHGQRYWDEYLYGILKPEWEASLEVNTL